MKYFLGVDGGQSSTTALIGDESGRVLGRGTAGPCNHASGDEGRVKLLRAVTDSVAAACKDAGLEPVSIRFESACFGMSGGPDDKRDILVTVLRTRKLIVTHDAAIALAGATASGQGIVVIAGTGSMAFGRNAAGKTARAGGWGYVFGDEGGAFDLVRQALRAALRMEEGWGPRTALRQALLDATDESSIDRVMHLWYTPEWPRSRVAALAPLVERVAADGDTIALRVLEHAAQELATLVSAVRGQLWQAGEAVVVAHAGGVFQNFLFRERFRLVVELAAAGNTCGPPLYSPAEGALKMAIRSAGEDD